MCTKHTKIRGIIKNGLNLTMSVFCTISYLISFDHDEFLIKFHLSKCLAIYNETKALCDRLSWFSRISFMQLWAIWCFHDQFFEKST